MIERITLENFKSHRHTTIELGRLTALAGPNASGKTSVLEALHAFSPDVQLGAMSPASSWPRRGEEEAVLQVTGIVPGAAAEDDSHLRGGIIVAESGRLGMAWASAKTHHELERLEGPPSSHFSPHAIRPAGASSPIGFYSDAAKLATSISRSVFLQPHPTQLAAPSYSEDIPPTLNPDGTGLASVVAYLMTAEPERFEALVTRARRVLPFLHRLRVRPAKVHLSERRELTVDGKALAYDHDRTVTGQEIVADVEGADDLPADALSEGTLLILGILTLLESGACPNLVLLDDVEQGLHPRAQRELVQLLRELLDERPELQIVMTTHSPYVLDEIPPEDVWILAADAEGVTVAKRLADHPDAARALEVLSTGELWDAEGEEWVLDERDVGT